MVKRALCIGIDRYPIPGAGLRGCVHDVRAWADVLVELFGFDRAAITFLTDEAATRRAMLDAIVGLRDGAGPGDILALVVASHGSYVPDAPEGEPGHDEDDGFDETLCPYDCLDGQIIDDELREIFDEIPDEVRLTVVTDSCHSGSVTRAPGDIYVAARQLSPVALALAAGRDLGAIPRRSDSAVPARQTDPPTTHVHIAATADSEAALEYDTGNAVHGAFSFHALAVLRETGASVTPAELETLVSSRLDEAGFAQHPEVAGPADRLAQPLFS